MIKNNKKRLFNLLILILIISMFLIGVASKSVEVYAEGDSKTLDMFRQACLKGPLWSRVDNLMPVSIPDAPIPPIEDCTFKQQATV